MLKSSKRVSEKKLVSYYVDEKPPKINLDMDIVETQSEAGGDNINDPHSSELIEEFRHDIESVALVFQLISFRQLLCKAFTAKTANRKLGYATLLTAFILILLVLPALMIIIGVHNLDLCPAQRMLPIWLITISGVMLANGVFNFLFLSFLTGCANIKPSTLSSSNQPTPRNHLVDLQRFLHLVVLVFHIIWFFLGTIWTMNLRNVFIDNAQNADLMCNKMFFQTVFGHLIVFWMGIAVLLSITCFYIAKKLKNLARK